MAYLIDAQQRIATKSTLFFEFQKGPFRNKFWKSDSVYLHADILDKLELCAFFRTVIPDFSIIGPTQISADQYYSVSAAASAQSGEIALFFSELDIWAADCFRSETCFTVLGI